MLNQSKTTQRRLIELKTTNIEPIEELSALEDRSLTSMANILLKEAIEARKLKN